MSDQQKVDPITKRFLPKVGKEQRAQYIIDALNRLEDGETTDNIAKDYGVDGSTLCSWLIVDAPQEGDLSRARFIGRKLAGHIVDIETAPDPHVLARARESFKAWSWIAERRLPALFGDKQGAQTGNITVVIQRDGSADHVVRIGRDAPVPASGPVVTIDQPASQNSPESVLVSGNPECA